MSRTERRGPWSGVAPFLAANVFFGAGLFAHAFLYNFYLDALGFGEGVMGAAAAAMTAGGLAALGPAGVALDRWGPRVAYRGAALAAFAGLVGTAFAEGRATVLAASVVAGAGTAAWRVAMGPVLMAVAPLPVRSRAFSWNVALLLASGALWTAASGALPRWWSEAWGASELAGLRVALVACACGTLASAALVPHVPPLRRAPVSAGRGQGAGAALRGLAVPPRIRLLALLVFVWMLGAAMVLPFFNLYFLRVHDLPVDRIGLLFGVVQALTALAVFAGGELAQRLGPERAFAGWAVLFPGALVGLALTGPLVPAVALYALQGLAPPATNPLLDELLLREADAGAHGSVSSWRNAATELSGLLGAGAGGVVLEGGSFGVLFAAAAAIAAAGAAGLVRALFRRPAGGGARSL